MQKGFTLIDSVVCVAIVGVLASIASYSYQKNLVKSQASEALKIMESSKPQVIVNINKYNKCTPTGSEESLKSKYGSLTISGSPITQNTSTNSLLLDSGCELKFTFYTEGVSKQLAGKSISANLFNNNVLSKSTYTTVDAAHLPSTFTTLTADAYKNPPVVNSSDIFLAQDTEAIENVTEAQPDGYAELVSPNPDKAFISGGAFLGMDRLGYEDATVNKHVGYFNDVKKLGYLSNMFNFSILTDSAVRYSLEGHRPSNFPLTPFTLNGQEFEVESLLYVHSKWASGHSDPERYPDNYYNFMSLIVITKTGKRPDEFYVNLDGAILKFSYEQHLIYTSLRYSNAGKDRLFVNHDTNSPEYQAFKQKINNKPTSIKIGFTKESVM